MSLTIQAESQNHLLRSTLGVSLLLLLLGLYLLTYRGHPLSIDEVGLFDSLQNFVHHQTLARTIEFYRAAPEDLVAGGVPQLKPLYEPLQIIAASPFYSIAGKLPVIGQFHAVMLLNVFVTALTAASVYFIATTQGYSLFTAWSAALIFGTATIALHYSRFIFREPLMGFFVLWAFFLATRITTREKISVIRVILFLLAVLGMILTKQVGVLFLPGIALCLIPERFAFRRFIPIFAALMAVVGLFLLALVILNPDFGDDRYSVQRWLNPANWGLSSVWESLLGYQISPGRSFWLYSPILLLGLPGSILLLRQGKWRLVVGIIFTLLFTSGAYGALRSGSYWHGGWNWGPRYMIPLVPVWMLLVLPVLQRSSHLLKLGVFLMLVVSVVIQVVSIAVPYSEFYTVLWQEQALTNTPHFVPWSPDNWGWGSSPLVYHLRQFSLEDFDLAWQYATPTYIVPVIGLLMIVLGTGLSLHLLKHRTVSTRLLYFSGLVVVILTLVGSGAALISLRRDARYTDGREDLLTLARTLSNDVEPEDVVLVHGNDLPVTLTFMNWFKADARLSVLPYAVREKLNPEEQLPLPIDQIQPLLSEASRYMMQWVGQSSRRVWLVTQSSEYHPDSLRPLENFMALSLFPIREIEVSQRARAVLFSTAPTNASTQTVSFSTGTNRLSLVSAILPIGTAFRPGDELPLSLTWQPMQPLLEDYHIAVHLLNAEGVSVSQRDSLPQAGFGHTSRWREGEMYKDNHALKLPLHLPSGSYTLVVIVYHWSENMIQQLQNLTLTSITITE
jgi:hypothetical protein